MTQGNPFGRAGGRWPPRQKLQALFNAGLTYDEIAQIVYTTEPGWPKAPSRSGVRWKLETLGFPPRKMTHTDLNPWRGKVKREHQSSRLRHMLDAESRKREADKTGAEISDTDRKLVAQLHELLFGRGKLQVVGYHPEVGYYLTDRQDYDEDIIRHPRAPSAYSGESPLRKTAQEEESSDGDGGPPGQKSSGRRRQPRATSRLRTPTAGAPRGEEGDGTRHARAAG